MEQDPLAIWESVQQAVRQAMENALEQYGALSVVAVGITNQRECAMVGQPAVGGTDALLHAAGSK